jgi:dihydroneopterin aldolase
MGDRIVIDDLEVTCIIGVLPAERTTPQPLRASLVLELDEGAVAAAAAASDLAPTVDYGKFALAAAAALEQGAFRLLEEAALALCRLALAEPAVRAVEVRLAKPRALGGRGIPSLIVRRSRGG